MAFKRSAPGGFGLSQFKRHASMSGFGRALSSGLATRLALRHGGSRTVTKTKRKGRQTGQTSQYMDVSRLYQRRPAPRRLARRIRKFASRVKHVMQGQLALRVMARVLNGTGTTTLGQQYILDLPGLLACNGSSSNGNDDLNALFNNEGLTASNFDSKLKVTSCVWDLKLVAQNNAAGDMFVDFYHVEARRDIASSEANSIVALWNAAVSHMATAPGAGAKPATSQVGISPFDAPEFTENIKITKVTRVKIEPNDSTSVQIRDPRNYNFNYDIITNRWAMKGVSEWVVPVITGPPTATSQAGVVSFNWVCSRVYRYRVDQQEISASGIQ